MNLIIGAGTHAVNDFEIGSSHYDIGQLIARMLGYTVVNPNDDGRTRFVNGPDIAGTMGWLRITKPADRRVEENDVRVEIPR